ncbi:hypothetical protein PTMSG1_02427 [Pyrenophora teres f. maculata]|nr:hypothetical protein PTMSG1_02427 [Pyrenophora teres f. maculata]
MSQSPPQISPEVLAVLAKDDRGPKTIGLVLGFTTLALVCVSLRFFARIKFVRQVGSEDYLMAMAMVFSVVTAALQVKQVQWGAGKHQLLVDLPSTTHSLRYLYWSILAYCVGLILTKISILAQYRRIFSVGEVQTVNYIVLGLCVVTSVIAFLTLAFVCIPVDSFWNVMKKPTAHCLDEAKVRYGNSTINTITDLMIAALPVRRIYKLQIVRKQKIVLIAILSLGWIVCIVSILRIHSMIVLAHNYRDAMYYSAPPIYWAAIEMNLAISCACAPALKPLVVHLIPAFGSKWTAKESSERSGTSKQSKGSGFSGCFRPVGERGNSTANLTNVEQGVEDIELEPVTTLQPAYQPPTVETRIEMRRL